MNVTDHNLVKCTKISLNTLPKHNFSDLQERHDLKKMRAKTREQQQTCSTNAYIRI